MIDIFIFFIFLILITYFSNTYNILPNYTGDDHQKFLSEKKVPLVGGFFVLIIFCKLFFISNSLLCAFLTIVYLIGILSDAKLISSPKIRLFLQIVLLLCFIYFFNIKVTPTRIEFFDLLLNNKFLSISFSIFCFLILINGSNFIDGLNGLLLGYVVLVLYFIFSNNLILNFHINEIESKFLIISLLLILIINYLNFIYLGDGGSYVLSLFLGYVLVSIYTNNPSISPYYVILLLWYPCFENLFSLLRKLILRKSPTTPDNLHLHQLLYSYFSQKIKLKKKIVNSITSLNINIFNFFLFYFSSKDPYSTIYQLKLILFSVIFYLILYFFVQKLLLKKKFNHGK